MPKRKVNGKKMPFRPRRSKARVMKDENSQKITISRQKQPAIADKQLVPMNYVDSFNFNAGVGVIIATRQFNLNNLFDPDRTGIGHQPMGRDQWAVFYNRYRVYKVRYEIKAVSLNNTNVPMAMWVQSSNDITIPAALETYLEQSQTTKYRVLCSNTPPITFTGFVNLPGLVGETDEQYRTNGDNAATFAAGGPVNNAILNVTIATLDKVSSVNVQFAVKLTYFCELFDRLDLLQS